MNKRREASFVSAVCGFPKDFARGRIRKGQFGDDAWFSAKFKAVEVIGKVLDETSLVDDVGEKKKKRGVKEREKKKDKSFLLSFNRKDLLRFDFVITDCKRIFKLESSIRFTIPLNDRRRDFVAQILNGNSGNFFSSLSY